MRVALVYLISILVLLLCCPMLLCLVYSVIDQPTWCLSSDLLAFAATTVLGSLIGYLGFIKSQSEGVTAELRPTDAFLIVTLTWFISGVFGALPYYLYGWFEWAELDGGALTQKVTLGREFKSFTNSFFESMSGFTTTGATIIERGLWHSYIDGVGYLEDGSIALPRSIMLWRCVTHLLGGMGIVVLGVAILPVLGVGGMQLYHAEVPGPMNERFTPRVGEGAKILWKIYGWITLILALLYWALGMDHFEAICHSMSTMATGGFSTRAQSIAAFTNPAIEWCTIIFMLIAGVNFTLYSTLGTHWRSPRLMLDTLKKNAEFVLYIGIIIFSSIGIALSISGKPELSGSDTPLRAATFQVLSVLTTTGYASADFEQWLAAPFAIAVLMFLMFIGGCAGSTGGGVKVIRHLLIFRLCFREFFFLLHPKGKKSVRSDGEIVTSNTLRAIIGFVGLYVLLMILGTLYFALEGQDLLTSFTAAAASLGNIGPGLGEVGPTDDFSGMSAIGKWVSASLMLMGRLEILTVMILFTPAYWRHWSLVRSAT